MMAVRWSGARNPATWYLLLGFALLLLSLWMPWATAGRTARVELRAEGIANALLEAADPCVTGIEPPQLAWVLARFYALAERDELFLGDLEVVEPAWPGTLIGLRNKHYLFHLAVSPPDPKEAPGRGSLPTYEVMAWPRHALGPAHSVFFLPQNAIATYTRNLAQGYSGEGKDRPTPGCAQRRQAKWEWTTSYRGLDDERWIILGR